MNHVEENYVEVTEAIRQKGDDVLLQVEVIPGSKHTIMPYGYNIWKKALVVKIKSHPTKGKANKELIKVFKDFFGCDVSIEKGEKNTHKVIRLHRVKVKECEWKIRSALVSDNER